MAYLILLRKKVIQINSKYFTENDFRCKGDSEDNIAEYGYGCGCNFSLPDNGMNEELIEKLDALRDMVGHPIYISCGYRCQIQNDRIKGSVSNSQHVQGIAADIYCNELSVDELAGYAEQVGFRGIGRYYDSGFVHVDVRDYESRWTDRG